MRASICILAASVGLTSCYSTSGYQSRESLVVETPNKATGHAAIMGTKRAGAAKWSSDDLEDLGGPVIADASIYAIWWGNQSNFPPDQMSGIDALLSGLGGSPYLATVDQYIRTPPAKATFVGHLMETSPSPTHSPSTQELVDKVCQVLADARQMPNVNALYLVFTDGFPDPSDFCGFHDVGSCSGGQKIHIAYLPNLANAPQCDPGDLFHCNGLSEGTRAIANVTAHEVIEMITDPDLNAWVDRSGEEIADKCNFQFGSCVTLGSSSWQVQKQWSNADHGCVQQKGKYPQRVAASR